MKKIFIADKSENYIELITQLLEKENKYEISNGVVLSGMQEELYADAIIFELNEINIKMLKSKRFSNKILIGQYSYENLENLKETKDLELSAIISKTDSYSTFISTLSLAFEGKVIMNKNLYNELIK